MVTRRFWLCKFSMSGSSWVGYNTAMFDGREFLSRVSTAILMRDIDICPSVCLSAKFR